MSEMKTHTYYSIDKAVFEPCAAIFYKIMLIDIFKHR